MTKSSTLVVLKFGGSVLSDARAISRAVEETKRYFAAHDRVLVVVSAFKNQTDLLEKTARDMCTRPAPEALAFYMGLGELRTAGELTLGLQNAGINAGLRMPWDVWFLSSGDPLEATPVAVSVQRFLEAFNQNRVIVFPGFIGRGKDGQPHLLGRGGSDLTAIFLAAELGADRCILIKDAPGIYEWDPAAPGPAPRRYSRLSWSDAIAIGGRMLKPAHAEYARSRAVTIEVTSPGNPCSTVVGAEVSEFAPPDELKPSGPGARE